MLKVALTGSIAMGKSEVSRMFGRLGVPVFDADDVVHHMYSPGGTAVPVIAENFPDAIRAGAVDRNLLSKLVIGNPAAIARLESLVHPLVRQEQDRFCQAAAEAGAAYAVFDIPLLFETSRSREFDRVIVVSAPADVQKARALKRQGMTIEKLDAILSRQVPDEQKRLRADFVVDSSGPLEETFEQVQKIANALENEAVESGGSRG